MTVTEIFNFLQQKAPFETAEPYDNVGLLVGGDQAVTTVLVTLDITHAAVDEAVRVGAQLIVSHHPVIFDPLRSLQADSVPYRLARHGISAICAHTNLDRAVGGVNDRLCELLNLTDIVLGPDEMCRIGTLPQPLSAEDFARLVSRMLDTAVRVKCGNKSIRTVALCGGGAGDRVLPLLKQADAALTGEVKHHVWLEVPQDKTMVDAGHYATEVPVTTRLVEWLSAEFPKLSVVLHYGEAPYSTIKD